MVELSNLFRMCFHPGGLFDVQFTNRVKPLQCNNNSSTLVIRGLLEAISSSEDTASVSDVFRENGEKKQKTNAKLT